MPGKGVQNEINETTPSGIEEPAPGVVPRRGNSYWLAAAGGAAGLLSILIITFVAGIPSRRPVESVSTRRQPDPVDSAKAAPSISLEPTLLPSWAGRRQPGWGPDGSRTISFALDAISDVLGGSRERPQLIVRCLSRKIDVYVVTGPLSFDSQNGSHAVRVRVDDEPEQSQRWLDSEASRELFAPDGVDFAQRLTRAQRLRVGFTPFNARPVTAEFILAGFEDLAPIVARTCGGPTAGSRSSVRARPDPVVIR